MDTLESLEGDRGDWRGHRRGRSGLKTYEQLRILHPERGHAEEIYEYSLEERDGLMKSITSDIKSHYAKFSRAAAQKLRRHREAKGCIPSFDWRKSLESLPFLITVRTYQREYFANDLAAGLTEGIVCIPMGMSYALLANLPAVYGLYTSLIPPLMYLLFGTCNQLSLGVSAIESLLVAAGVSEVIGWIGDEVDADTTEEDINTKVQVTLAFTLCVGFWQMIMRIFGVGAIATFLSDPVLSGFSTASAFLIGTSQLKHLVGYELPKAILPVIWYEAVTNVPKFNIASVCVGVSGILLLMIFKKLNSRYLPHLPLPSQVDGIGGFSSYASNLAIQSLLVAVICYIITISIGKTFQRINDNAYKINGAQARNGGELVAMASANMVGSLFKSYPASGSLSRTAVVQSVNAKTRMHLIPAVVVVMLVLVAITPLLYTLPKAILASVVMFGVVKMVDFRDAKRLYHLSKPDFFLWNVSFWVTAIVGPIKGIAVSVVVSLLYLLKQTSRPANSTLGRLPETREYRNIKRFPMAKEIPGIRIFRFDSSLHFANKDYFENRLKALAHVFQPRYFLVLPCLEFTAVGHSVVTPALIPPRSLVMVMVAVKENNPYQGVRIHTIVLDASSINQLDASAIDMLILVAKSYDERGVSILCANWKGPQRDLLELSGFYDVIPPANLFLGLHDAVVEARKSSTPASIVKPTSTAAAPPSLHSLPYVSLQVSRHHRRTAPAPSTTVPNISLGQIRQHRGRRSFERVAQRGVGRRNRG
ncbi:sulP [Ectocarpus sp. CCAP 1310/34]|nr:sulP [Ectocarpus sp. CCAP 1310/34]